MHPAELAPLLEYYQAKSQLTTLNGSLSFAEVARELFQLGQKESGEAPLIRDETELDTLLAEERLLAVDGMASWCVPASGSPCDDAKFLPWSERTVCVKRES